METTHQSITATGSPRPSIVEARPVTSPAAVTIPAVVSGLASTYGPGWSPLLVALPQGPGYRFTVCGAGGCRTLVSTDSGPSLAMQRLGRIVDLPVWAFEAVCGESWTAGLCRVTVQR